MATFAITPVTGFPLPTSESFPEFIQFQKNGVDLGSNDADTVNFTTNIVATRGTGENSGVITVSSSGGGGGGGPIVWRSADTDTTLVLADAENGIAMNGGETAVVTIPLEADVPFDAGVSLLVYWESGVQPTFAAGVGVTLVIDPNFTASIAQPGGVVSLVNREADTWILAGDMTVTGSVGQGTVTSVDLTMPAEFSVAGNPVTDAGTLAVTKATQSANLVWAGPTSGSAAAPAFRALVDADLPAFTWRTCSPGNYTLVLGDAENGIIMQGGTLTIPPHSSVAFPDGTSIVLLDNQYMNPIAIAGGGGVTVRHRDVFQAATAGLYATVTLIQQGTDNWILAGDLELA